MTIQINANDIWDARHQIGMRTDAGASVTITFRKDASDYGRNPALGVIVENKAQNRIPLEFISSLQAIAYIKKILLEYDKHVRAETAKRKKEAKKANAPKSK